MAVDYELIMQKTKDGSAVKSSLSDFGFAVCEIEWPDETIKELATRSWPGEHGEDTYLPPEGLKLEAFDLPVEFVYKGNPRTALSTYNTLRSYIFGIDGSGAGLKIYDPYWGRGFASVHAKKISDLTHVRMNTDEYLSATVTFRVLNPTAGIVLNYVGN